MIFQEGEVLVITFVEESEGEWQFELVIGDLSGDELNNIYYITGHREHYVNPYYEMGTQLALYEIPCFRL